MKSFILCVLVLFIFGTTARADCIAAPIRGLVADTIRVADAAITATAEIIDVARIGVRKSARAITMRGVRTIRAIRVAGIRAAQAAQNIKIRSARVSRVIGIRLFRTVRIVGYFACG